MTAIVFSLAHLPAIYKQMPKLLNRALSRGVQRAGYRAISVLIKAVSKAPPAGGSRGRGGAVNTGFYKKAWKMETLPDGVRIYNAASYASIIEYGRRAGSLMPPKEVIVRWIQRRLGKSEKEARSLQFVIRRAIKRRGLRPRRVLTDKIPDLDRIVTFEVGREVSKAFDGGFL